MNSSSRGPKMQEVQLKYSSHDIRMYKSRSTSVLKYKSNKYSKLSSTGLKYMLSKDIDSEGRRLQMYTLHNWMRFLNRFQMIIVSNLLKRTISMMFPPKSTFNSMYAQQPFFTSIIYGTQDKWYSLCLPILHPPALC